MPEFLQDNGIWEVWARGKEPLVHRPTRLTWLLCPAVGEHYSDSPSHPSQSPPILQSDDFWGYFSSNLPSLSHSAKNSPFLVCCFNEEQREFHTHTSLMPSPRPPSSVTFHPVDHSLWSSIQSDSTQYHTPHPSSTSPSTLALLVTSHKKPSCSCLTEEHPLSFWTGSPGQCGHQE